MSRFYDVKVSAISKTTEDCSIITLDIPKDLQGTFNFKQGQYLTIKANINGEDIQRSYSLCTSPIDKKWAIGVKKIEDGKFSTYANDLLTQGDTLKVMPPNGNFYIDCDPTQKRNYIAFAAGSGITPMLSIIRTHLEVEPKSTFKLFYTNKQVSSIILKEEIEAIKNQHMERFEIFHFLTKQKRDIPLFNGRINKDKLEIIFKTICNIDQIDHYFSCGPEAMVKTVESFLIEKGVSKTKIHFELFNTGPVDKKQKDLIAKKHKGKIAHVTITEGGKSVSFEMAQGKENLLDAALNNAADLPFACKGGVCSTCRAKLIEGKVEMLLSYGLEKDEIDNGYILTCQSLPVTKNIIVDFDI